MCIYTNDLNHTNNCLLAADYINMLLLLLYSSPQLYYSTDRLFKILFVTCYLVVSYFQV